MKPPREATATAVATGGLSLPGKGFWDRITSERKVGKQALKAVDWPAAEDGARPGEAP